MNAKELIISKYKAVKEAVNGLFEAPVIVPTVDPAPVIPTNLATYKLKDGTEISISGETIEVGAAVTIGGAQAPSGEYELEDGRIITVDETGAVKLVVTPDPVTQPEFVAPPAKTLEERIAAIESKLNVPALMSAVDGNFSLTVKEIEAMYAKFATGTPEERLANLEIMVKAMMEYNFGYKIREGQENAAIEAYKNSIAPVQTGLQAAEQKITKQDEVIKGLFELVEKLVEEPTAEPKTLTEREKQKFDRQSAKDERLKKMSETIAQKRAQYENA